MADDLAHIPGDPFAFQFAQQTHLVRAALVAARPLLSAVLQLPACRALYRQSRIVTGETFEARVLRALDVRFRVHASEGSSIPVRGPLIVAANHPTGALDGLVVAEAVRQVRPDVRVLANHWLAAIPELRESCFFVDPFGGPSSAGRSLEGLRAAHVWLRNGGALIVFPSGEVASRPATDGRYVDRTWLPAVGRLAIATRAAVAPVFLDGRNSALFHAAGRCHPGLRTLLLPRELLRQRGSLTRVALGPTIEASTLAQVDTPEAVTAHIRQAVDALASSRPGRVADAIVAAVDPEALEDDVDSLPVEARLLSSGAYEVYCTDADRLPHVLREIGRLREITFRAVGEGTGRALDLDRFDGHYQHLFVWNRARRQVVGAYRVAVVDRVVARYGLHGLYTRTLFSFDERLLGRLNGALELGRSFVREEYQRSHSALLLLWRGIGELVLRSRECRILFGAVSISAQYRETSQQMLREYLAQNHHDADLAALVQAINPPSPAAPPERGAAAIADIDELDTLISRLEQDQGVPVLLRQYLRLNATLLGFNVDPAFGGALDALMTVDLAALPLATLRRYLGREPARGFLARHQRVTHPPQVAA
jgi:putative hemolysin